MKNDALNAPPLILVIEDEIKLASIMIDYLVAKNYRTHHITNGGVAVEWIQSNNPDLILLDIMLPNKDGISICKEVRQFSSVPILMVTAKVEEIDRLLGLEIGADDYICKPFSPREVVARVAANLRRAALTDNLNRQKKKEYTQNNANIDGEYNSYRLPLLEHRSDQSDQGMLVDIDKMLVTINGNAVDLTAVEFRLLNKMASKPGQIFSRTQLIDASYNDNRIVSERTIDSHIKKLRKQLSKVEPDYIIVHSVYGVGYKVEITAAT